MALSWPTFILEIINFLVLVWILKRFLYKPILQAIAQRKERIDENLREARTRQSEAEALERQFQRRLAEWENEKEKLRSEIIDEVAARRAQLMAALDDSLQQERGKVRVIEERRLKDLRSNVESAGIAAGVQFTARLLDRASGPELEAKLIELALEDLNSLSTEQVENLRSARRHGSLEVRVSSAFAISAAQRDAIEQELEKLIQVSAVVQFVEDRHLRAGLRIRIGPWMLRANLADELEFFAHGFAHDRNH